jgi:hypothetical protein
MVTESEVPLGTVEPALFPGAPVVPKGTQCLDYPIFPALKRWAIFSEQTEPLPKFVSRLSPVPAVGAAHVFRSVGFPKVGYFLCA